VIHPDFAHDPDAVHRVTESKILLNLQHADFNAKRAELCQAIGREVSCIRELPENIAERLSMIQHLESLIQPHAPFSTAARFYLMTHRYLSWVQDILDRNPLP
jgi:hypothetical protein